MFNKAKEMFDDYKEMVLKPEKEFYKKHWVGIILVNAVPVTLFFATPSICRSAKKLKSKVKPIKIKKSLKKKTRVDKKNDFDKHVDETIAMVNGRQGS